MDALLIFLASIVALSLSYIFYVKFLPRNPKTEELRRQDRGQERPRPRENVPRRAQLARNRGARLRVHAGPPQDAPPSDDENDPQQQNRDPIEADLLEGKIGAKKRAKLEARAEKKAMREAEEQSRADKRKKEQLAEEERKKLALKEEQERKQREEEERQAREEQERKEHEEYLKMKEAFSIEEEGYEEDSESNETNLLQEFVNYIKNNKVVLIEDLAAHFKLKTQATIDRIKDLQKDDILSGVIDDRGKFIYISAEEMEAVAKFIRQRGRVSITELAENSNKLINLTPVVAK